MSALSPDKPRVNSIPWMLTQSLGYCCTWFFFARYGDNELIAARLGVTERAVRAHRAACRDGEHQCRECSNCMKEVLTKC